METTDEVPTTRDLLDKDNIRIGPGGMDPEERVHLLDSIQELGRDLNQARQEAVAARQIHLQEIATITEKLIDAAESHDMCSTYDSVIDNLNRHLTVKLGIREQESTIRIEGSITVDFSRYLDVALPYGTDLDSDLARERARSALRAMGLRWITDQADPDSWDISIESIEYD